MFKLNIWLLAVFAIALSAATCFGQTHERWAVKTATDQTKLDTNTSISTVCNENSLPRPSGDWSKLPRQSSEQYRIQVTGTITHIGKEPDGDFHIVLENEGCSMIVEIPNPALPIASKSPNAAQFKALRQMLQKTFGTIGAIKLCKPTHVIITGYGFFDKIAHGEGHAENGREIHPCISIQVSP